MNQLVLQNNEPLAFTNGLHRKINSLAEKSLLVGYQKKVRAID